MAMIFKVEIINDKVRCQLHQKNVRHRIWGHKNVGARFPPQMSGTEFGHGTEAFIEDL